MSEGLMFRTGSERATRVAGERLAGCVARGDVLSLSGDLGAGKTCLVKGLAAALGVPEPVTSPTFNILVRHEGTLPLHHFDLYRLEHEGQLEDIDFYGTLEADGVSVVEWGDRFPGALPEDHLSVEIRIEDETSRVFVLQPHGERSSAVSRCWLGRCEGLGGEGAA